MNKSEIVNSHLNLWSTHYAIATYVILIVINVAGPLLNSPSAYLLAAASSVFFWMGIRDLSSLVIRSGQSLNK